MSYQKSVALLSCCLLFTTVFVNSSLASVTGTSSNVDFEGSIVNSDLLGVETSSEANPSIFSTLPPDEEGPTLTITPPSDVNLFGCHSEFTYSIAAMGKPSYTAYDECGTASVTESISDEYVFCAGADDIPEGGMTILRTFSYLAEDCYGNETTDFVVQTITVTDNVDPEFVEALPGDITVDCESIPEPATLTATDNCDSEASVVFSEVSSTTCAGIVRTWVASDDCGNTTTHVQNITVTDDEAPVITGMPADINQTADLGDCGAVVIWAEPAATDNCALDTFTSTHSSGQTFNVGTTVVTYTATDECANSTSLSFTIIVTDDEKPTITGTPADMSQTNDAGDCSASVSWVEPTAADNCDIATFDGSHDPGDVFPVGTTTVTYTATDIHSNVHTTSFVITVTDDENPTIANTPASFSQTNDAGDCSASVSWVEPTAADNCDISTFDGSHDPGDVFPVGTTTVTYTATDIHSNVHTTSFVITVTDDENPTIANTPASFSQTNDAGDCSASVSWVEPTAADNCDISTFDGSHDPGDVFPVGTTTVTYTATDIHSNVHTTSFVITVTDDENPTISGTPASFSQDNDAGDCSASVSWTEPTAADNCDISTFDGSHDPGDVFPVGTTTVTYTATDIHSNVHTTSFDITVVDVEDPSFTTTQSDITQTADAGECGAVVMWTAPTADDNCSAEVTSTHNPGDTFEVGETTVTYTATDDAENAVETSFTITVTDNEAPVINDIPSDIAVNNDEGLCGAEVTWTEPTVSDNCDGATIEQLAFQSEALQYAFFTNDADASPNYDQTGSNAAELAAMTDASDPGTELYSNGVADADLMLNWTNRNQLVNAGLDVPGPSYYAWLVTGQFNPTETGTYTFTIEGDDGVDLFIDGTFVASHYGAHPINSLGTHTGTIDLTAGTSVSFQARGQERRGGEGMRVFWRRPSETTGWNQHLEEIGVGGTSLEPGDVFPVGEHTVFYVATDAAGNMSADSFTITVTDNELPTISTQANIAAFNDEGLCTAEVTWDDPEEADNCGIQSFTSDHDSGDDFPVGTTTVTYTAVDVHGLSSTMSFDVVVTDNEKPTITGTPADMSQTNDAGDCSASVTWIEPTAADNCDISTFDGSHDPGDVFPVGTTTVTYTATDIHSNVHTTSFVITVTDDENPTIANTPASFSQTNDAGDCSASVSWVEPTAADNCDISTLDGSHDPGDVFPVGTTTVTYTATDIHNNVHTTSFVITVTDDEKPTITGTPADFSQTNDAGNCSASVTWTEPTAADNCDVLSLTADYEQGHVFPVGTTEVTYTATDIHSNVHTTSFIITVTDDENPQILSSVDDATFVNSNIEQDSDPNLCSAVVTWDVPYAEDNCEVADFVSTHNSGETFPVGTTTVTYTATDIHSNINSMSFDIIVVDAEDPTIEAAGVDYSEDFEDENPYDENDLCSTGNEYTPADGNWSLGPACTLPGAGLPALVDVAGDTYLKYNDSYALNSEVWNSADMDVSSLDEVDISFNTMSIGSLDGGGGNVDYFDMYLVLDGTQTTSIYSRSGHVGGGGTDSFSGAADVSGASTLSLRIRLKLTGADESYLINDIRVSAGGGEMSDITVNNDAGLCSAVVMWAEPTAADNCGVTSFSPDYASGYSFPVGETLVTYTAQDAEGNQATMDFTVTVIDNEDPELTAMAANKEVQCDGSGNTNDLNTWLSSYGGAAATDNCTEVADLEWSNNHSALSNECGATGSTTVTFSVEDEAGNISTTQATFTIVDTENPNISAQGVTLSLDEDGNATLETGDVDLGTSDDCSDVVLSLSKTSFNCSDLGDNAVTLTAEDDCENESSEVLTIVVEDNLDPIIVEAACNMEVECDGAGNVLALENWLNSNANASATDNCGPVTWANDFQTMANSCGGSGAVQVIFTASDPSGNETTTSAIFTILDTTAPELLTPAANAEVECDGSGNTTQLNEWLDTHGGAVAEDLCSGVTWTHNYGDGATMSDGCGATGTVTVTFTASDPCNNVVTTSASFTILDETDPIASVMPYILQLDAMGDATLTTANIDNGSSDGCSDVSLSLSQSEFSCIHLGDNNVTLTVEDDCDNTDSAVAVVTVKDEVNPTITVEAIDETYECNGTDYTPEFTAWLSNFGNAAATDACGPLTWSHNSTGLVPGCGNSESETVTFSVQDGSGNISTTTATFSVTDTAPPTIASEATDILLECDGDGNTLELNAWLVANGGAGQATDLCGNVTWSNNFHDFALTCAGTGAIEVIFTATDECGNAATTMASFTIEDTTAPEMLTPASNDEVECDGLGNTTELNAWLDSHGGFTVDELCGEVNWDNDFEGLSDDCGLTGSALVNFTATDDCGNSVSSSATFTIKDETSPIALGQSITVYLDGDGNATITPEQIDNGSYDGCGDVSLALDITSFDCEDVGENDVVLTVTDECMNAESATVTVIVTAVDDEDPTLSDVPDDIETTNDIGACGAVVNFPTPILGDNCIAGVDLESTHNSGDLFVVGTTTVTFTATDESNNETSASFDITVTDTEKPTITGTPADFSQTNDAGDCSASVSWVEPTAADNCDIATFDGSHDPGDVFPVGTTTVTYTATDIHNNVHSTSFVITVTDDENPTIANTPASFSQTNDAGDCSASVSWVEPTAADNCDISTFDGSHDPGDVFPVGTTTVTYTATDIHSNVHTTSFVITVTDDENPTIANTPASFSQTNDAGDCSASVSWVEPTAADNCDISTFDGSHDPGDVFPVGTTTVTYTATDIHSNVHTTSFVITVTDDENPTIANTPASFSQTNDAGDCSASVSWVEPTAADNCDISTFDGSHDPGDVFPVGTTTVTYTATDIHSNVHTTSFVITVTDDENPTIANTPASFSQTNDAGDCSASVSWVEPTAADNCDIATFDGSHDPGDVFPVGTTTVTYTATDIHSNVHSTSFVITVTDDENPVITTPADDLTVECDGDGNLAQLNGWLNDHAGSEATDNCAVVSITNDYDASNMTDECGLTGAILVTFTYTDAAGNFSTTSATFTIEDTTGPTFQPASGAGDMTVECDGYGNVAQIDAWLNLVNSSTASDVCGGVTIQKTTTLLTDECAATGETTVNFLMTDACENTTDTTLTFIIEDTQGPVFLTTADDLTVECDGAGNTAALQNWLDTYAGATAEDVCGDFTWSHDFEGLTDDCGATGSRTVTFTATDECGNDSNTSATFTIEDTTAPTIASEAVDMTVECDGEGNTAALNGWLASNGGAGAASDICGGVTWSNNFTALSNDCGATGSATVIFTATDDCGNPTSTTATFTIEDTIAPSMDTESSNLTVECDGEGNQAELNSWLNSNGGASASDDCSGVTWSNNFEFLSDLCGATGAATVVFTATDDCGHSTSTTATFTIEDTLAPSMDVEASNMTVECDGAGNPTELNSWLDSNGGASASDECSGVVWTNNFTALSDLCGATGAATVIFTATDDCGLSTSTTATFTIVDTTAPVLTGDEVVIIDCSAWPWDPLYQPTIDELLTVVDTSGNPMITLDEACGYPNFPIEFGVMSGGCNYDHQLIYYPVDDCGNAGDSLYQVIQVDDFTDPEFLTVPADTMIACTEDVMSYLEMATAEDACDPSVNMTFEDEVLPTACPEEYTIRRTFYAEDCGYNIATAIQNITVADTAAPALSITAPVDQALNGCLSSADLSEDAMGSVTWTTSDDCGDVTVTYTVSDANSFSCTGDDDTDEGSHVVTRTFTVTAIDCAGNSTEMSVDQTITITDDSQPALTLTAPADMTLYLDENCSADAVDQAVSGDDSGFLVEVSDNCDSDVAYAVSHSDEQTYLVGSVGSYDLLRTYTVVATDDCGNSTTATTTHTISYVDNTEPALTLIIPSNATAEVDADGNADLSAETLGLATMNWDDNCSGAGSSSTPHDGSGTVACGAMQLTGVFDLSIGSSNGKAVHVIATEDIADLSVFGIGVANNGGGTDGQEYTFPAIAVSAGDEILVARNAEVFGAWMGDCMSRFDHVLAANGDISQNGDDAIELFQDGEVIATYGDIDVDGSGEPWDYLDTWAYYDGSEWIQGAVNCTDNTTTMADSDCPYPGCTAPAWSGCEQPTVSTSLTFSDETISYTAACCYTFERTWTATATDNNGNTATASDVQTITVEDNLSPSIDAEANATASCDLFGMELTSSGSGGSGAAMGDLQLTGVFDLSIGGSNGKAVHVIATADIADLSAFGIGVANNGGGTDGQEYTFPAMAVSAGDEILVARNAEVFGAWMGDCMSRFDHVLAANGDISQNGDDAIELFQDGEVIATYGDIDVDGSGEPWDYLDTWAYYDGSEWIHGAVNCTDGTATMADSDCPYPGCTAPDWTPSEDVLSSLDLLIQEGYVSFDDNCELASVEAAISLDGNPCEGAYDIVYSATDSCGNTTTASQRIVLVDTVDPILSVDQPEDVSMSAGADCAPDYIDGVPYPAASATDNCDADVAITSSHFDGVKQYSCLPGTGAFTVLRTYTFTAEDNCGNTHVVQVSHNVTVVDDIHPTYTVEAPADKTVNLDAFCSANTSTTIAGMPLVTDVADNCDSDVDITITHTDSENVYTCDGSDGSADGSYTFERTFTITAADDCGNETVEMVSQTITVLDVTDPTITAIAPMATANYTLDAACMADVTPTANPVATAIDACDSDVSISFGHSDGESTYTCDGADGSADGSYTFTRTWTITATDDCGNSTSQQTTQTVVVTDDAAPSLMSTWPADYTTDLDASCNADLSVGAAGAATATADDACDSDVSIDITSVDGAITYMAINADDVAEGGYHFTRTWTVTATDDCGNSTSETHDQLITANDVLAPTQELETLPTYSVEGCYGEVDLDPSVTGTPTVSAEDGCDTQVDIDLTYATDDLVFNDLFGNYNLILDTISGPEDGVLGMTTVRMYIETDDELDFVSAVAGDAVNPTGIRTTTSFYQNALGGQSANGYTDFLATVDPLVAYDSWVTIGIDQQADGLAGEVETTVVGDWTTEFEAGGNILISDFFGGSWFTTNPNTAAVAGGDHRVLLGQFTTDGQMSGQVFVQVFPQGLGSEELRLSFTFGDCAEDDDTPEGSYAFTRRWESVVTDDADNSSTAVTYQHIQVLDTEAPQLTNTCDLNNGEIVSHDCPGIGVLDFDPVPVACDVTAIDNCDSEVNVTLFTETEGYIPTDDIRNYCAPVTPEAQDGAQTCDDRAPEVIRLFNFPGADDSFVMADGENLVQVMSDGGMHIEIEVENGDGSGGFVFTADYGAGQDWTAWSAGGSNYKKDCAEIYPGQSIWEDWVYFLMTAGTLEGTGMYAGSSFTLSHQPANGYYGMQMGLGANNKNTNYGGSAWFFWQGNLMVDGVDMGPMASSGDVYMDLDCCLPWQVDYYYTALDDCGNPTGFAYSEAMASDVVDGDAAVSGGHTGGPIDITSVGGIKEPIRITGLAPNPTNEMSQLSFVVSENMRLRVDLYTMGGTLVQEMYEGNAVTGVQYVMNIDADALSDGMYQVRISSNSYLAVKKLLVAN